MEYVNYLREQASKFRTLAASDSEADEAAARELKELAETCEEIAAEWEEKHTSG
jgi:DNA-directed RNA polymerase subunit L